MRIDLMHNSSYSSSTVRRLEKHFPTALGDRAVQRPLEGQVLKI